MFGQILLALAFAAVLFLINRFSWTKASYQMTLVRDGDSIRITGEKQIAECRINGYDAPEWSQPHGTAATAALKTLLNDGYRWKAVDVDPYGRVVIEVRNAKGSIARQMVAAGYGHNAANWGTQQFIARLLRRGLWSTSNAVHPATYRAITPRNAR